MKCSSYLQKTLPPAKNIQNVTATEGKSVMMHRQFWRDYDIHKTLKNTDASLCEITAS